MKLTFCDKCCKLIKDANHQTKILITVNEFSYEADLCLDCYAKAKDIHNTIRFIRSLRR